MKAKKLLKTKNIKDTLFCDGNWITGGLSELMNEFANQQNKELIENLIIEVTKEADKIYPSPHGTDIRKAIAFVSGGNYILNQLKKPHRNEKR